MLIKNIIKNKNTSKMYTILYTKDGVSYEKKVCKSYICITAAINHKHIHKIDIEYRYNDELVAVSLDKHIISSFYYSIVNYENCNNANMWEKIKHVDKDYFIYGFISYVAMFFLFEQTDFLTLLPINFDVPCTIERGDCCDAQIMRYMDKALKGIINTIDNKMVYHYLHFVQQFIAKHGKMFHIGPIIDKYYHTKLENAISKLTQKTAETFDSSCDISTCDDKSTCDTSCFDDTSTCDTNTYDTSCCDDDKSTCEISTTYNNTSNCTNDDYNKYEIKPLSFDNNSCDVTSDNIVSYYTCSTCNDDTCTCEQSSCISEVEECHVIQLTFGQTCIPTNLTEADKMYIRQMIREEIQKYMK